MIVVLANLVSYISIASTFKYLPDASQSPNGSSISFHEYTAEISSIPHHVLIVYSNLYCSGSLVRSRIVVTAASCFEGLGNNTVIVKVGSPMITGLGQVIETVDIKPHEYFGHNVHRNNDIAILLLKEHVTFGENVKKILLIEPETAIRTGSTLDVSGWGSTNHKPKFVNYLLLSEMVVMDEPECKRVYAHLITSSNFCVKYQPERKLSDNGGPAVYSNLLVGLVSFGAAQSDEPYVAVLTNISYFHRWIALNSKRMLKKYCIPPQDNEYAQSEGHDSFGL